jgi:hypothetical protein
MLELSWQVLQNVAGFIMSSFCILMTRYEFIGRLTLFCLLLDEHSWRSLERFKCFSLLYLCFRPRRYHNQYSPETDASR